MLLNFDFMIHPKIRTLFTFIESWSLILLFLLPPFLLSLSLLLSAILSILYSTFSLVTNLPRFNFYKHAALNTHIYTYTHNNKHFKNCFTSSCLVTLFLWFFQSLSNLSFEYIFFHFARHTQIESIERLNVEEKTDRNKTETETNR